MNTTQLASEIARAGAATAAPESLVLLKHKLFHLDNHLPLVFSLVEEGILRRPLFVAPDRATYDTIVDNVVLYDGIAAAGGRLIHLMPGVSRLLRNLHTLWMVRRLLYRPRLLCVLPHAHAHPASLLCQCHDGLGQKSSILTRGR